MPTAGGLQHRLKSIVGKLSLCSLDVFGVSLALKEHCVTAWVFLSVFQNPIRITCSHCSVCSISDIVGISVEYKFFPDLLFLLYSQYRDFSTNKKMFSGNFFWCAVDVHSCWGSPSSKHSTCKKFTPQKTLTEARVDKGFFELGHYPHECKGCSHNPE
jgi:hypothetical protein